MNKTRVIAQRGLSPNHVNIFRKCRDVQLQGGVNKSKENKYITPSIENTASMTVSIIVYARISRKHDLMTARLQLNVSH